jgi:DNA polymerase elongation subunit (family B)
MLLDIEQEDGNIKISYYDKEGNTQYKQYKVPFVGNWYVCNSKDPKADTVFCNWDGRPVKRVKDRKYDKFAMVQFLEGLPEKDREDLLGYNFPKIYFVDIEVEVSDGFPEPEKAENPITTFAIVTPKRQCIVLATRDLTFEEQNKIQKQLDEYFQQTGYKFNFSFKKFNSEYDMLYTFLVQFVKKFPMMTGWNFVAFDWKYIITRAEKLGIDPSISSPSGTLWGKDRFPQHVGILDYLELYRKWDRTIDIKENFTLDWTAEKITGLKKIKYTGTLQDLYESDYEKYVYYNCVDTALVYLIHEKIKTMEIALTIANICEISIYRAASPVAITESLLCRKFLKMNKVMAIDQNKRKQDRGGQYAGAYVKEPVVGMHSAVACFDFASLYPSIMRQINVSPDSFIKKVDPTVREVERASDRIVSVTGAVYKKDDSILKDILTDLYTKRKVYKKKYFELLAEADKLEKEIKSE